MWIGLDAVLVFVQGSKTGERVCVCVGVWGKKRTRLGMVRG